jgi:hypothetical protein
MSLTCAINGVETDAFTAFIASFEFNGHIAVFKPFGLRATAVSHVFEASKSWFFFNQDSYL